MENNENLVLDNGTENVEQQTTEENVETQAQEPEKIYTEEDLKSKLNEIIPQKNARTRNKIQKEFEGQYGELLSVLRTGLGNENATVEELTGALKGFYEGQGVKFSQQQPNYSQRELEVLANADANEIISAGFDEVVEEAERLKAKGVENMDARDKALFVALTSHIKDAEVGQKLSAIGVKSEIYNSKEFKEFASKFNADTPITDVYALYAKTNKNTDIQQIGSMKNGNPKEEKTFYTPEEVDKLTEKDYEDPKVRKTVRESMLRWKN